jgi:ABC-2 type transport system permease protein
MTKVPPHSVSLTKGREDVRIHVAGDSSVPFPLKEKDRMRGHLATAKTGISHLTYISALLRANWREHYTDARRAAVLSSFMFVQNLIFFLAWVFFFGSVGEVRGWHLHDVAILYGFLAFAVGLAMFLGDGIRALPLCIQDGSLDSLIVRPRHPLPALMFSRSSAASLGDVLSAPLYWFAFGGMTLGHLPTLLVAALLAAATFQAATVLAYSVAFWLSGSGRFSDQLFEILIIAAAVPQHGQPLAIKLVLFTAIPAGFITLTPVSLMQNFDAWLLAGLAAATLAYAVAAVLVFNAGLKRYVAQDAR